MSDPLAPLYVHEVTVEPYLRKDGYGRDVYAPARMERVMVDDKRRLVRDATGAEVVSEITLAGPLSLRDLLPGSRVTLPAVFGGRRTTVLALSVGDMAGRYGFPEHVEAALK